MIQDPGNVICHLQIDNWAGISLGAIHYYGTLWCGGRRVQLTCKLTPHHCAILNKESMGYTYRPGQYYNGFLTEKAVIAHAIRRYVTIFPHAKVLLLGSTSYVEPKVVAHHGNSTALTDELNELCLKYHRSRDDDERDAINDTWEKKLAASLNLKWEPWK